METLESLLTAQLEGLRGYVTVRESRIEFSRDADAWVFTAILGPPEGAMDEVRIGG